MKFIAFAILFFSSGTYAQNQIASVNCRTTNGSDLYFDVEVYGERHGDYEDYEYANVSHGRFGDRSAPKKWKKVPFIETDESWRYEVFGNDEIHLELSDDDVDGWSRAYLHGERMNIHCSWYSL